MAAITFEKLLQSLENRKFEPVYFLQGNETWYIDQISDFFEKNTLSEAEKEFNQTIFYGADTDVKTLKNACMRYPLMSQYQLIIVKEAQLLKGLGEMESYFEKPAPSTILVICHKYKNLDKRLKVTKVLEKNAVIFESKKIAENRIHEWIIERFTKKDHRISEKAANLLFEYLGNDLEKLDNAIEQLCLGHAAGEVVTETDIEKNIGVSREYNVFELTNALGNKNFQKLSKLVSYINATPKDNPMPVITAILYGYFSKLSAIYLTGKKDKTSLKEFGIMEWFQRDYIKGAETFGPKLKEVLQIIEEYDLRFKGVNDTGTEDSELMKEMIYRIAYIN